MTKIQLPDPRHDSFIHSVEEGDVSSVVSYLKGGLFSDPVNPNYYSKLGKTALMVAASNGYTEIAQNLIRAGAALDAASNHRDRWTPVFYAAVFGHASTLKVLLEAGASPHIVDSDKATPLIMAATSRKAGVDITDLLINHGADVNAMDKDMSTPLMMASRSGTIEIVEILLQNRARVNDAGKDGSTALIFAASSGRTAIVELLLRYGASIDAQNNEGFSALFEAARLAKTETVAALVKAGASVVLKKNQRTVHALDYASATETREAIGKATRPGFKIVKPVLVVIDSVKKTSPPSNDKPESTPKEDEFLLHSSEGLSVKSLPRTDKQKRNVGRASCGIFAGAEAGEEKKYIPGQREILNRKEIPQPQHSIQLEAYQAREDLYAAGIAAAAGAAMIGAASVGVEATTAAAVRFAPVFGSIYLVIQSITNQVNNVIANKDNCRFLGMRCLAMKSVIEGIEKSFAPTKERIQTLALLVDEFEATLQLVTKYTDAGWLRKLVSASSFKNEFLQQDRRLTALISDLSADIGSQVLSKLSKHIPYVEVQLDAFRAEIVSFKGKVTDDLAELKRDVKTILEQNGNVLRQLEGERGTRRGSGSRLLQLAQRMIEDELTDADVEKLASFCTRRNRIGKGSFGSVYKGSFRGIEVAIKEVELSLDHKESDTKSKVVEDFKQEVAVLRLLRSSRLVQFIGASTRPPNLFLVTEYLEGGNLFDLIRRLRNDDIQTVPKSSSSNSKMLSRPKSLENSPVGVIKSQNFSAPTASPSLDRERKISSPVLFDKDAKLRIATQIATGLSFLHQHSPAIVHRDLKSRNILLDASLNAKICDFGLSRTMTHSALSTAHHTVGTPQYMAPEVLKAEPATAKADIYSFGVLLFEMYTGKLPWENLSLPQVVTKVIVEKHQLEVPPSVPKRIQNIISLCTQADPADRPDAPTVLRLLRKA